MGSKHTVHVLKQAGYDAEEIAANIQTVFISDDLCVKDKVVVLKPSFVFPAYEKMTYSCTHPELVVGVCAALDRLGAKKVFVVEGPTFGPARYNFYMLDV